MFALLALIAAVVASGGETTTIQARRRIYASTAKPERMGRATMPEAGLKVFGDSISDTATWRPMYARDLGCGFFRWGVCVQEFLDSLDEKAEKEGAKAAEAIIKVRDYIMDILRNVYEQEMAILEWILDNVCLRFKFPLRRFEDEWGGKGWVVVSKSGAALASAAPDFPLPPRDGWRRVWFRFGDNMMRSETVVTILDSKEDANGIPVEREIASTEELRGAMRMDPSYGTLPSPPMKYLAGGPSCGDEKARFWLARRGKAKPEFR